MNELDKNDVEIVYMTCSEDDPAFKRTFKHIKCEYIGEGNKAFSKLNLLNAYVVFATTPSLDVFQWKRSKNVDCYIHIMHAAKDLTMYRMYGTDHYDAFILAGDKALVYNIEASYTPYSKTGCVMFYFGCEKENVDKCIKLVLGELAKLRDTPLSSTALRYAKKQLLAQNAISSENGEAQALAIGRSMLNFGDYMSDAQVRNRVEALTAEDLQAVAREVFAEDKLSFLIYR